MSTISLWALVAVVCVSCITEGNVGLIAMGLTWILGVYVSPFFGESFPVKTIASWFPVELFLTLAGITFLFSIARQNGSLALVTNWGLHFCRRSPASVPGFFFALALLMSASGAGNVPTVALLASSAMLTARRLGISPIVMTIMIGHGSIAGTLSPLSPMGVIADQKLTEMGLGGNTGHTFLMNLVVNVFVAAAGYLLLRGWRLVPADSESACEEKTSRKTPVVACQRLTFVCLGFLMIGVLGLKMHVGFAAFAAATLLVTCRAADERLSLSQMPWNVILMVCGMSMLVTLCEETGGLRLFSRWLAAGSTPDTITAWMAGITGLISVFSSTSGVVLPAFLPTVPDVLAHVGGTAGKEQLLSLATAVNIGSNLVDVSSVSTIGALCVAATPGEEARRRLFQQAFAWGLSMTIVGAAICWLVL